ncbi:MAG: hypothetical protein RR653_14875, partial [Clostridia bacterium]
MVMPREGEQRKAGADTQRLPTVSAGWHFREGGEHRAAGADKTLARLILLFVPNAAIPVGTPYMVSAQ